MKNSTLNISLEEFPEVIGSLEEFPETIGELDNFNEPIDAQVLFDMLDAD